MSMVECLCCPRKYHNVANWLYLKTTESFYKLQALQKLIIKLIVMMGFLKRI